MLKWYINKVDDNNDNVHINELELDPIRRALVREVSKNPVVTKPKG